MNAAVNTYDLSHLVIVVCSVMLISMLVSACVAIPVPTGGNELLSGTRVTPEHQAALIPGTTTREEIVRNFGQPSVQWDEARVIAYHWDMRAGIVLWALAVGYGGDFGAMDMKSRDALLLQFDTADVLVRFEQVTRPVFGSYTEFVEDWVKRASVKTADE